MWFVNLAGKTDGQVFTKKKKKKKKERKANEI